MDSSELIYLDHAAATPVCKEALVAMRPYFDGEFFNPSAAYLPAKKVAADYEAAKAAIAHAIGAKAADLVITAGATEANNLAMSCVGGDVLYLEIEHDSVRQAALQYGGTPVKVLPTGVIDLTDLRAKLTDSVELITVGLVNNEIGVIQPLAEIAQMVREVRLDRWKRGVKTHLYLHSDASQALNLLDVNVARLGVDLLTLNSAKVYGPKGVGALYVGHGVKLAPVTVGGGQENGLRSGTENVPGVVGFAAALTAAKAHLNGNRKKYAEMKRAFLKEVLSDSARDEARAVGMEQGNGAVADVKQGCESLRVRPQLDNFVNLCYNGIDGERLVFLLEERSILVATGAACAASKGERSHVLAALGLSGDEINGSLRITFGETNTLEQVQAAARVINEVVAIERRRVQR